MLVAMCCLVVLTRTGGGGVEVEGARRAGGHVTAVVVWLGNACEGRERLDAVEGVGSGEGMREWVGEGGKGRARIRRGVAA